MTDPWSRKWGVLYNTGLGSGYLIVDNLLAKGIEH